MITVGVFMQPTSPVELEMQRIFTNLQTTVAAQPQSLEELFKEQVRHNAIQNRILKGCVVSSARDIIRNLLPELKSSPQYQKALEDELKKFSKINIAQFIHMLEQQVAESDFELESEDSDWALIPSGGESMEFSEQLREYILSATNIPDPLKQRPSTLGKIAGVIGTGVWYAGWSIYQILRVSFYTLQFSVGVAPLIPFALILLRSRAAFI